jgi:hypothetical protein
MNEDGVDNGRSVDSKEPKVDNKITSRHPWHGVGLVLFGIEDTLCVDDSADVESGAGVIESVIGVDGEVCSVPCVCPVQTDNPDEVSAAMNR